MIITLMVISSVTLAFVSVLVATLFIYFPVLLTIWKEQKLKESNKDDDLRY